MTTPVPEWVYRSEIRPPETDLDPAPTRCASCGVEMAGAGILEHLDRGLHAWTPARAGRETSRAIVAACVIALALLAIVARWTR